MKENLLTETELASIIEEAKNPIYSDPTILQIGTQKQSIRQVNLANGLIMPYGNESTGYKHILERHSPISRIPYWDQNGKIDNPTKFSLELQPLDFISVAAEIFKQENLNISKNKKPNQFDLYLGYFKHNNSEKKYNLITYKGTKVIHTLFLAENKRPFNKKKVLNLIQGWSNSKDDFKNGVKTFEIPYINNVNFVRFIVIIRCILSCQKEEWHIQVNTDEGAPFVTYFIKSVQLKYHLATPIQMRKYDFGEITTIEKIIKKISNEIDNDEYFNGESHLCYYIET